MWRFRAMLPGSCPRQQLLPVQRREESDSDTGRRKHSRESRHARDMSACLRRTDLSRGAASPDASLGRERPRASSPEVEEKSRHRGFVKLCWNTLTSCPPRDGKLPPQQLPQAAPSAPGQWVSETLPCSLSYLPCSNPLFPSFVPCACVPRAECLPGRL